MVKKKKSSTAPQTTSDRSGLLSYFRFGESYTSLILGMVVVILAVILLTALFRNRNFSGLITRQPKQDISATRTGPAPGAEKGTYTVRDGDNLWVIAEKTYKSGYNWVDVAKANNISNPDSLEVGMTLKLPEVAVKVATMSENQANVETPVNEQNSITGDTYTVQNGDYLWKIAERAYNDGYRWVQIARDNDIQNPDLIYSGTVLRLKRS